jgi:hypothetical protein
VAEAIKPHPGSLRPVARGHYPSYRLNYFKIEERDSQLVINYVTIPKTPEQELTWLQRLLTFRRTLGLPEEIPAKTVIDL